MALILDQSHHSVEVFCVVVSLRKEKSCVEFKFSLARGPTHHGVQQGEAELGGKFQPQLPQDYSSQDTRDSCKQFSRLTHEDSLLSQLQYENDKT